MEETIIYIDSTNLHRAASDLGFEMDYQRFRKWLSQKYKTNKIYLFIGFVSEREPFYKQMSRYGYTLFFKEPISFSGTVKGNCDAELIMKCISDFYKKSFAKCILITGDGDFGCLVRFLEMHTAIEVVVAPSKKKCSLLLKNKNTEITFLNNHYHKFAQEIVAKNEKAPDAD